MFDYLIKVKVVGDYLVNDRGTRYKKGNPVKTAELSFYGYIFINETIADIEEYKRLEEEIKSNLLINAWLDAGITEEKTKTLEFPDMDVDGTVIKEPREILQKTRKIEFYHLGG